MTDFEAYRQFLALKLHFTSEHYDYFRYNGKHNATMFEEHTGEVVEDLVIMMVAEDGEVQLFEKKTVDYLSQLENIMDEFYENILTELQAA